MNRNTWGAGLALAVGALSGCGAGLPGSIDKNTNAPVALAAGEALSRYIKPLVGTFPPGFVNPGPFVPFGMVQPGPDTEGPLNYGGYSFQNLLITGFSQIHMSAGVFKAGQIPLMPLTGAVTPGDLGDMGFPSRVPAYASPFDHVTEVAEAGYYAATLLRYGVRAEMTSTERAALYRFNYQLPLQAPRLLLHASREHSGLRPASVRLHEDGSVTGAVQTGDNYSVYYALQFDSAYTAETLDGAALVPGAEATGENLGVVFEFAQLSGPLLVKVGISFVDAEGARRNLDAEIADWDFERVRTQARAQWDEALARVVVEGGTEAQKQSFYTALARVQQFPNLHSDVDGRYAGPDDRIHQSERPHYSQFSLWDSYRGQNQMLAEIVPDLYRDMVNSLLDFHRQAGRMPRWQQAQRDAGHMSGDPAIFFVAEGWCRGHSEAETRDETYAAMRTLTEARAKQIELGYSPVPKPAQFFEQVSGGPREAGTTLEFGLADFALAQVASVSGRAADAEALAARSLNYRNLTNPDAGQTLGFIRPRHEDGSWLTPFAPELPYGFQEGTSWQYSWLVMHDLAGLYERMGGEATVKQRLNTFFGFPVNLVPFVLPTIQNQITVFGVLYYGNQFAPGNEHDIQAPYLYNYAGAPWQTQAAVRATTSIYAPTPLGLPGNDDLGALSGALVWNMIGVYPMNPGAPLYVIGSPHFEKVTLRRPGGDFVLNAPGASSTAQFVDGAALNGEPLARTWFVLPGTATELALNATVLPDTAWGADPAAYPPSLSNATLADFGCRQ